MSFYLKIANIVVSCIKDLSNFIITLIFPHNDRNMKASFLVLIGNVCYFLSKRSDSFLLTPYKVNSQNECEPVHEISNNLVCATSKASDQPAHTRSLIRAFACRLSIL